jgi:heme-degrading monooxygenase HmoA
MIALFFEVTPRAGQQDRYLEIAGSLRGELEASGGLVYLDRLQSLSRPRTMLSHQLWADEAALARWRANGRHYGAQTSGRSQVFEDYRLRVGAVMASRAETGAVEEAGTGTTYNDPSRQPERWMAIVRSQSRPFEGAGGEAWQSVYTATQFAWVGDVPDRARGLALIADAALDACVSAAQLCLVSRDYGMFDRREAPQYFPAVKGA